MQLALPEIEAFGAHLVAVAPELPDKSLSTAERNALAFEVLSDVGNKVARDFGLVFSLAEDEDFNHPDGKSIGSINLFFY